MQEKKETPPVPLLSPYVFISTSEFLFNCWMLRPELLFLGVQRSITTVTEIICGFSAITRRLGLLDGRITPIPDELVDTRKKKMTSAVPGGVKQTRAAKKCLIIRVYAHEG